MTKTLSILLAVAICFTACVDDDVQTLSAGVGGGASPNTGSPTPAANSLTFQPSPSPDNSPLSLTVNGTALTLLAAYDARDATATSWPARSAGPTLAVQGTGAAPTTGSDSPLITGNAVLFNDAINAGKYYESPTAAPSSDAQVGTAAFVVEMMYRFPSGPPPTSVSLFGNASPTTPNGWDFAVRATPMHMHLHLDTSGGGTCVAEMEAATQTPFQWNYAIAFVDPAANMRGYVNATAANVTDISACNGHSADAAGQKIRINAFDTGAGIRVMSGGVELAFARVWRCPVGTDHCFGTTAEQDAIALKRALQASTQAKQPNTYLRATSAYVDKINSTTDVRSLFNVGINWPRVAKRKDANGSYVVGYLSELAATNTLLRSAEFDNASWTAGNGTVTADTTASPEGLTLADTFTLTSGAGAVEHTLRQAAIVTAAKWVQGVWAKAGTGNITHVFIRDATVANAVGWVKLSDCSKGTAGAGLTQLQTEKWGNGWCRIWMEFSGTAASHNFDVGASNADNVTSFDDGTSTSTVILWGATLENNTIATSYIPTAGSTATRNLDLLRYWNSGNMARDGAGIITFDALYDNVTYGTGDFQPFTISDGGGTNYVQGDLTGDHMDITGSGGLSLTNTGDQSDGINHEYKIIVETNNSADYRDGTLKGIDTSNTLPTGLNQIDIGDSILTTDQCNCLITKFQIQATENAPIVQ